MGPLFELASVLVRLNHVASFIVNANHSIVRATVIFRVDDCIRDGIRPTTPESPEWQTSEIDRRRVYLCAVGLRKRVFFVSVKSPER